MIVKNESRLIRGTLENLCTFMEFDYWVICDTGSTDGTQDIIRDFFKEKNIKGELYEDQWKDFAHNRNLALERAYKKSEYLWIFDADDLIRGKFCLPRLVYDKYSLKMSADGVGFWYRSLLVRNTIKWKFYGVLHEFLDCAESEPGQSSAISHLTHAFIDGDYYIEGRTIGGNTVKDKSKYVRDGETLAAAYENEQLPFLKARYAFYCGQSFRDGEDMTKSLEWYLRRTQLEFYDEEIFISYYNAGMIKMLLKHPEHEIEECFLKGHLSLKPADRIECLYGLVAYHRTITKNYFKSYMYGKMALEIKTLPKRRFLFVEKDIYDYKLMCELANTCYHLGKNEDAYSLLSKSVAKKPDDASILNMMVLTNKLVSPLFELEKIDMIPPSCRVSGLTLVARYKSDIDLFIVSIKSLMKNAKDIHLVEKYILVIRNHDLQYLKEILNVFPYFVVVSYKEESEINSKLLEVLKDEDKFIFYIEDPWFCLLRKNYFAKPISFLARNPKYEQFIYIRNENSDPFEYKQQDNGKFILSDKIYENDLDHISTCPSIFRRSIYRNDTKNFKSCFLNQIQFVKLNKYY